MEDDLTVPTRDVPRIANPTRVHRGAASTALLGGLVLLLGGVGLGLVLASGQAPPQGAYELPVVAGRPRTRRPAPRPATPAPVRPTPVAPPDGTTAPAGPDADVAAGGATTEPAEAPLVWRPGVTGLLVAGAGAPEAAQAAEAALGAAGPGARDVRVEGTRREAPEPAEIPAALVGLVEGGIRLREVAPLPLDADPISDAGTASALALDALVGSRLPVGAARGLALAALVRLLADDAAGALVVLDAAATPSDAPAGIRVLAAAAAFRSKALPRVHELVKGLGADPDVGAVARFLTGAALLSDANPREAIRDLEAAVAARPDAWPARLLLGIANDRLALADAAADAYAEVLRAIPGRPEAVVGYAPHLARTDLRAATALVERLLSERPTLVPGWWQLAWLRRKGDTSEDRRLEVDALERVTKLRPDDADAWGALGGARTRLARAGGGVAAYEAASAAFQRQAELAPDDALAWFNRAATLHQVAVESPLGGNAELLAPRISEANATYAKALARGLSKTDAARVQFNIGLLFDTLPRAPSGADAAALGRRAQDAYAAALAADPGYVEASLALLAAQVGARDVAAARRTLAGMPPGADPREKAVLEAALAQVQGDVTGAKRLLAGPGRTPVVGTEALPTLARELLVLGYRRLVDSLLASDAKDAARLVLRARARAGLGDVAGTQADLAALAALDAGKAADLRRNDPDVRRTLGAPPKG